MRFHHSFLVAAVFAATTRDIDAAETYRNPVIEGNLADPTVIRHDGKYYLYATGEVDGDNGYRVYTSDDLVNWNRGPVVFRPGQPHIWAPDVWRDPASGRFYLYFTANKTVGVADAEGPMGPFTVRKKLFDSAIDAHLFRDDNDRLYLYVVQLPGFRITAQQMSSPTEPAGEARVILQPESKWETRNGRVTEGPWMIKHKGRYYLIYSGSGANTPDYAVGYATSKSPLGPFTRAETNPIIQRSEGLFGPGHGCAIRDKGGQWWHLYHQKRTARRAWDRFICLDPLRFDEQGRLHGRATRNTVQRAPDVKEPLRQLPKAKQNIHRFSMLTTAQQVRDRLGTDEEVDAAEENLHDSYPQLVTAETRADRKTLMALKRPGKVFFRDGFESPESLKKYFEIRGLREGRAKLTTSAERAHRGSGAMQFTAVARDGRESGAGATAWFGPDGYNGVYFRRYIKFAADYDQGNLNHVGGGLTGVAGTNRWGAMGSAGIRPKGNDHFKSAFEPWRGWGRHPPPGYMFLYTYWMDMKRDRDGNYWGNMLGPPNDDRMVLQRDKWYCLEHMIQVNDPGKANGELAAWIDGELYLHYTGFRWRTTPDVKLKRFGIGVYVHQAKRDNTVWYDDVALSTGYIGPLD